MFNGCYHGTVDDVFVDLADGEARPRASLLGQVYDLTEHTRVAEFNDLAGWRRRWPMAASPACWPSRR
ncbi:aminotransferase [Chromobacterium violaceum]|uniref:Aminotransferase n=1 Tax=Chromobacterium violaceum TaxID=536 RepID=A0A3S4I8T9_CHRVL|nr:aminotransferase [Chromobacterium violaceum]